MKSTRLMRKTSLEKLEVLRTIETETKIIQEVLDGKDVPCPSCGVHLNFDRPNGGRHPRIYCTNSCVDMLLEMRGK